jgi:hypothetical protein
MKSLLINLYQPNSCVFRTQTRFGLDRLYCSIIFSIVHKTNWMSHVIQLIYPRTKVKNQHPPPIIKNVYVFLRYAHPNTEIFLFFSCIIQKRLAGFEMHIQRVVELVWYEQNEIKIKHTQNRVKQTLKQMWMTKRDGYMIYRYTTVHVRFPLVFSGVRVTRSLVLCVCCAYHCLSFCTVSFSHCVVCSSSIYGLWLHLLYLQTLLMQCLSYMI